MVFNNRRNRNANRANKGTNPTASSSDKSPVEGFLLKIGDKIYWEAWETAVLTEANAVAKFDIKTFCLKGDFPLYHSQNPNYPYQAFDAKIGVKIPSQMPGHEVDMQRVEKLIDLATYLRMDLDEQATVRKDLRLVPNPDWMVERFHKKTKVLLEPDDREHLEIIIYTKITMVPVPRAVEPLIDDDPYTRYPRLMIMPSRVDEAVKLESLWARGNQITVDKICKRLSDTLSNTMQRIALYVEAKRLSRPDGMLEAIRKVLFSDSGGSTIFKNSASPQGIRHHMSWYNLKYNPSEDVEVSFKKFETYYQQMLLHGVGAEKYYIKTMIDGVEMMVKQEYSTINYIAGVTLMMKLRQSHYESYIQKLDEDGEISAPTCHYDWARNKFKTWDSLISQGVNGKKRSLEESDRTKDSQMSGKIAAMIKKMRPNHDDPPPKGAAGGKSESKEPGKDNAKQTAFDKWKKKFQCTLCEKTGHFPKECPTASEADKEKAWQSYLEYKKNK